MRKQTSSGASTKVASYWSVYTLLTSILFRLALIKFS